MATTKVQELRAQSSTELENSVLSYIAQGYSVSNRTDDSVTLFKKKEFNILWAIIGFFLCWIPLIIYAIVYSQQSDEMIIIRLGQAPAIAWSQDRLWWSDDGTNWHDAASEIPVGVPVSDDRHLWWDGTTWCPVPAAVAAALPAAPPAPVQGLAGSSAPPPPAAAAAPPPPPPDNLADASPPAPPPPAADPPPTVSAPPPPPSPPEPPSSPPEPPSAAGAPPPPPAEAPTVTSAPPPPPAETGAPPDEPPADVASGDQ